MLDRWFLEEARNKLSNTRRLVIIDKDNRAQFLKDVLQRHKIAELFELDSGLGEIKIKYEVEKNYGAKNVVIFSRLGLNELTFIREYCATGGFLDLTLLHRYIKQKIHEALGFDLVAADEEIIAMGKLSVGKGRNYWDGLRAGGKSGIFSLEDILDFISQPENIFRKYGKEEKKLFCEYMSNFTRHGLVNKPARTVAWEIAESIFSAIIEKQKKDSLLIRLYEYWTNSKKHELSLKKYLEDFHIADSVDIWNLPTNHPFAEADRRALGQLVEHIEDKNWISDRLDYIEKRSREPIIGIIEIKFWRPILTLFSYDVHQIDYIHSLEDAIIHYVNYFYKLDNDIRRLYSIFLAKEDILKPLQNYYQQILELFLSKWFQYFEAGYKENQQGLLEKIINENKPPIAIIVGDAISYGISQEISYLLKDNFRLKNKYIRGGFPSETLNNMSKLFTSTGELLEKSQREKALISNLDKNILFSPIDKFSVTDKPNDFTIFYCDDVDSISEKQNQKALKYYNEIILQMVHKIKEMIACGYKKVFLVSDHGFVLTGILDESDKIEMPVQEGLKLAERYCLGERRISTLPNNLIEIEKHFLGYHYIYFAKSHHPFKTIGAYGFAHGGLTPQELIVPFLQVEKIKSVYNKLKVEIGNKDQLNGIVGDVMKVVIRSGTAEGEIFAQNRQIQIVFIKDKTEFYQADIIKIEAEKKISREFPFGDYDSFEVAILDANTREILDSCKVNRIIARDLGGLGGQK